MLLQNEMEDRLKRNENVWTLPQQFDSMFRRTVYLKLLIP